MIMSTLISPNTKHDDYKIAYFGGGCFWCVEAVFEDLNGVIEVTSGYAGGEELTANYINVSSGKTNHAEICKITYNPELISYEVLLKVFFSSHDPTTINQQGNDIGPQYRSIIFWESDLEKQLIINYINDLLVNQVYSNIKTQIIPFTKFYEAEKYHQNYFKLNNTQPYCKYVINPKLKKIRNELKEFY